MDCIHEFINKNIFLGTEVIKTPPDWAVCFTLQVQAFVSYFIRHTTDKIRQRDVVYLLPIT